MKKLLFLLLIVSCTTVKPLDYESWQRKIDTNILVIKKTDASIKEPVVEISANFQLDKARQMLVKDEVIIARGTWYSSFYNKETQPINFWKRYAKEHGAQRVFIVSEATCNDDGFGSCPMIIKNQVTLYRSLENS